MRGFLATAGWISLNFQWNIQYQEIQGWFFPSILCIWAGNFPWEIEFLTQEQFKNSSWHLAIILELFKNSCITYFLTVTKAMALEVSSLLISLLRQWLKQVSSLHIPDWGNAFTGIFINYFITEAISPKQVSWFLISWLRQWLTYKQVSSLLIFWMQCHLSRYILLISSLQVSSLLISLLGQWLYRYLHYLFPEWGNDFTGIFIA